MDVALLLSAMRRNKSGAILIALQVAVTLAILCNALFVIHQRLELSARESGVDEANAFVIDNQWAGKPNDLQSRLQVDISALRNLPDVVDAYVTNSYPLANSGWWSYVNLRPQQTTASATAALYFAGWEELVVGQG